MSSEPSGSGMDSKTVDTLLDSLEGISKPKPGSAAYRRCMAWERLREQTLTKVREERQRELDEDCTFQPTPHSQEHFQNPQRSSYRSSSNNTMNESEHRYVEPSGPENIVERLTERSREQDEALARMQQEQRRREEEECTFQPNLNHQHPGSAYHRKSSGESHQSTPRPTIQERATESYMARHLPPKQEEDPECTFQPQIGPKSRLVYQTSRIEEGSTDVFNRLYQRSTPARAQKRDQERRAGSADGRYPQLPAVILDEMQLLRSRFGLHHEPQDGMQCFLQNILEEKGDLPQPVPTAFSDEHYQAPPVPRHYDASSMQESPVPLEGNDHSRGSHSPTGEDSKSGVTTTTEVMDFQEFLQRQDRMNQSRRDNYERLTRENTPKYKPSICDESSKLASEAGWVPASSKKRRDEELERRKQLTDPALQVKDVSFKPSISHLGKALPSRTPEDMWKDEERRQKTHNEMQQTYKRRQMEGVTFKPETNQNVYTGIESFLGKDLTGYTEFIQNKKKKAEERAKQEREKQEAAELASCSFKPKRTLAPSYISRMAQGTSVLRESSHLN